MLLALAFQDTLGVFRPFLILGIFHLVGFCQTPPGGKPSRLPRGASVGPPVGGYDGYVLHYLSFS